MSGSGDSGRPSVGTAVRGVREAVTARAVVASPRRRWLSFVALQTVAVALLAGVAFRLTGVYTGLSRIDVARSGPGATQTTWLLVALVLVALLLYLAVPVVVAWYVVARSDRHWLAGVLGAGVAIVALPWFGRSLWLLLPGQGRSAPLGLLGIGGGIAVVVVAHRLATNRTPPDATATPPAAVLLGVLLAGTVGGSGFAGLVVFEADGPATALVEHRSSAFVRAAPTVSFDFEYESAGDGTGVLTVTHDGGETLDAGNLSLDGSGFVDVPGTAHTEPGPWATGGDGTVEVGDSTTIGVRSDPVGPGSSCEVRVVWEGESPDTAQTVGLYDCSGRGDPALELPSLRGGG